MWEVIDPDDDAYHSALQRLEQKHPAEFAEVFKRLKELCHLLNSGMSFREALSLKWVHHRYHFGMKSLAGGSRRGQATLRLYVFPDQKQQDMVVLGIGDKNTQAKDVKSAERILMEYLSDAPDGE